MTVKPRDKTRLRVRLSLIGALAAAVAALMSALQMQGRVRTVDILTLFAGGFAAGVCVVGAVVEMRRAKAQEPPAPGSPTSNTL
jgi:hypothetical protein